MARFLSNAKFLSSLVDGVSVAITRRGYAAAATEGVVVASNMAKGSGARSEVVKVKAGEGIRGTMKETSETKFWAPDPVTGYYRPENVAGETDVATLRELLLNKVRQQL
ncbi:late embryogenesis abundant protein Lea5-like isoform X2 [Telopea speciosissima]|uniref:late embryogenesis abundant protein Lea5-like isoform X2 n=1 Tax=Telopea speciosissima TaxID=54955 RepID=UPI001CC58D1E|nr:late embryogenesis abundant protein Lea5-like isoform X2 [Telopea speciosissima]